jgi:hypothetical protein
MVCEDISEERFTAKKVPINFEVVVEVNFKASRVREPKLGELNLCEPGSHSFSVSIDLWFIFFHSLQISREPVNKSPQRQIIMQEMIRNRNI